MKNPQTNAADHPPSTSTDTIAVGADFKRRLAAGDTLLGAWCAIDSTTTLEAMTTIGFDWIMIDGEHGLASAYDCAALIQAADRSGCCVFVRIPTFDPALIGRVLDCGAHGIMLPKVNSPELANKLVAACRYPPRGQRGIGPHRASGYFANVGATLERAHEGTVIAAQIEDRAGLDNLDSILSVEGIDIAFVGPADLSASLGHLGDPGHPDVAAAVARIASAAEAHSVASGYYCGSGKEAKQRATQGFQMVNVGHELATLIAGMRRQLAAATD